MAQEKSGSPTRRNVLRTSAALAVFGNSFSGPVSGKTDKVTRSPLIETSLVFDGLPNGAVSRRDPFIPYLINEEEQSLGISKFTPPQKRESIKNDGAAIISPQSATNNSFSSARGSTNWLAKSTGYRNMIDKLVGLSKEFNLPSFNIEFDHDGQVLVQTENDEIYVEPIDKRILELNPAVVKLKTVSDEYRTVEGERGGREVGYEYRPLTESEIRVTPKLTVKNNGILDVYHYNVNDDSPRNMQVK